MVLALFFAFFLFGCSLERDNPYDPHGINYDPSLYSSSSSLPGSSSSIPEVMVLCRLSDGTCPLTLISQEACVMFGGTPVQSCAVSSSSAPVSSSSTEPSSSSAVPSSSSSVPSSSSLVPSSSSLTPSSSSLSHIGKGNTISNYRTVAIGTQTWMAENLDYVVEGSKCYNNDPARCNEYGSLYNWSTAMALPSSCNTNSCANQIQSPHRGICPSGWHIPSDDDWNVLMNSVGGSSTAGKHLKSKSGWTPYSGIENLDTYGFSALPGGDGSSDGSFGYVGNNGYWWSTNENDSGIAYSRNMYCDDDYAGWGLNLKSFLFSVRCVQD